LTSQEEGAKKKVILIWKVQRPEEGGEKERRERAAYKKGAPISGVQRERARKRARDGQNTRRLLKKVEGENKKA